MLMAEAILVLVQLKNGLNVAVFKCAFNQISSVNCQNQAIDEQKKKPGGKSRLEGKC